MEKIKVFSFWRSKGIMKASIMDFQTLEDAEQFIECCPGQRIITIGDAEFQRGLELLGAKHERSTKTEDTQVYA